MLTANSFSSKQVVSAPTLKQAQGLDSATLVIMIKSKNEKGFQILYDKYCGALYGVLLKFVVRTEVADDLLQDTFVKIWKNIQHFDPDKGTLFTWMLNIARNLAIDHLRSVSYQQELKHVNIDLISQHIDNNSNLCANITDVEINDFKSKALQLDKKYAEIIDMIFFYGWTHEQTSKKLDLPLGTVKTRARKALELLKTLFQQ